MDSILQVVPYGENIAGDVIEREHVQRVLDELERSLQDQGLTWADVSLLILANSKEVPSHRLQQECDVIIKEGLEAFCSEHDWFPSLIGSTTFSGFFRSHAHEREDISNGLLLVAVCSAVFDRIPVAREFERVTDRYQRKYAGSSVLTKGILAFQEKVLQMTGTTMPRKAVADSDLLG